MNCIFCNSTYNKEEEKCTECGLSNQPRMLVDYEIKKLIEIDVVKIRPILKLEKQISPFGIDLTLDTKFKKVVKTNYVSINPLEVPESEEQFYENTELLLGNVKAQYVLHPGEFALGQSFEFISLPDYIGGGLDGKSSLGRIGITVHTTAASVDPGFKGHITFELFNAGSLPIILHPLQSVARLVLHLTSKSENPYKGKYSAQTEVRASRYFASYFSETVRKKQQTIP